MVGPSDELFSSHDGVYIAVALQKPVGSVEAAVQTGVEKGLAKHDIVRAIGAHTWTTLFHGRSHVWIGEARSAVSPVYVTNSAMRSN